MKRTLTTLALAFCVLASGAAFAGDKKCEGSKDAKKGDHKCCAGEASAKKADKDAAKPADAAKSTESAKPAGSSR
jgi:hypothetical protein